jgi:hypothetical protein
MFAELLDRTFHIVPRTWVTTLVLGGVLFVPTSYLIGWAYGRLFDVFGKVGGMAGDNPTFVLATLGIVYLWLVIAVLAQGLVQLLVRACVTEHAGRAARGEDASSIRVIAHVIGKKYGRLIGQRALQLAILSVTFGAAATAASVAAAVAAALNATLLAILLGGLLGCAGLALTIWLSVRFAVTLESLVIDGVKIEESFNRSTSVVHGNWWRVFGCTLLFGLMVSFASSLIATPIVLFSGLRRYVQFVEALVRGAGTEGSNRQLLTLLAGMGRRMGLFQYVSSLLGSFVTPVFMTLLFLELKKRHEPAAEPPAEPAVPAQDPSSPAQDPSSALQGPQ